MILSYLLKTVLISGLLTGYYLLFLRNRGFHRFNRIFLLSAPLVSFLLPLFRFEWPDLWRSGQQGDPIRLLQVVQGEMEETVTVYANRSFASWFTWQNGLAALSVGISVFLLLKLIVNLYHIRRLARRAIVVKIDGADLCLVKAKGTPFSFFRRIFWNPSLDTQSPEGRQILQHELYHVRAHHSLDILWLELLGMLAWFNPFLYLIRKEVIMIHEFMADADAAADPVEYAGLLVKYQSDRLACAGVTHSFFHHPLKRRIIMLTRVPFQKNKIAGRLMLLPLLALLTGLFAFRSGLKPLSFIHPVKKIKIVLDPGHGGNNGGVTVNGIREQDFNLMLAKKIREVARSYDVELVLTREGDNTPEPEQTLRSSLEYRAKFAADQQADAFISLHMNGAEATGSTTGFELYVPRKGSPEYERSVKLGSAVNEMLSKDGKISSELKEREQGIYILNNAKVPAILLELGNMNDKHDMEFIGLPANQEKIARDIIEGVLKFSSAGTSYNSDRQSTGAVILDSGNAVLPDGARLSAVMQGDKITVGNAGKWNVSRLTNEEVAKIDIEAVDSMHHFQRENSYLLTEKDGTQRMIVFANQLILVNDSVPALKKVEVESEFPGGSTAWRNYLLKNLHYPAEAITKEVQGTVAVEFVVNADGTIDLHRIRAISGPHALWDESMRVIRESGKWTPAMDHGVAVNAYKIQPISYKLEVPDPKKK